MIKIVQNRRGFTLIELILVVVIIGILTATVFKNIGPITQAGKIEETKKEMNELVRAICGNPELQNNGVRTDFGYVGDVGSMPPNLDALFFNSGDYATWRGPYIKNSFEQVTGDYKKDAWQTDYAYSGGNKIISTGSGSSIICNLSGSIDDLLDNTVSGNIYDRDGTTPGTIHNDSVLVRLIFPDGNGSMTARSTYPDKGGYFRLDSIPIGNHNMQIIYIPDNDTLKRFVTVTPNSVVYGSYYLASNVW